MDDNLGALPPQVITYDLNGNKLWDSEFSQYTAFYAMSCDTADAYIFTDNLVKMNSAGAILWESASGTGRILVNSATNTVFMADGNSLLLFDADTGAKLN